MKNQVIPPKSSCQSGHQGGNALIIILVTIALLVGLTLMITRLSSKTTGNINSEQARMMAESIMRTAQTYEGSVQRLMNVNRCSENELNFDNTETVVSYDNTGAPSNGRCDLYGVEGAGLSYTPPNPDFLDPSRSAKTQYGEWAFYGTQCILEVGDGDTTCGDAEIDLMMNLPHIRRDICIEINNLNGITNPSGEPPTEEHNNSGLGFKGAYSVGTGDPEIGEGVSGAELIRHTTGCFKDNAGSWSGSYIFYHVLLVR
ncbi:MAG TPA: hypothetical protein PLE43_04525 [Alphaproteobacteria bacterium]|nr:hypothetical protein [Alphaproteobacteria bacterium]HRK97728.1 hypothetical protein [Alphaproteobacteria bacterium]